MHLLYTMRFKFLCYIVVICLGYSCSYKQQHVLFENKPAAQASKTIEQYTPPVYHIKPDDILQIRNLQDYKAFGSNAGTSSTSQLTFQVEEDGNVTLPVLGHVPVAGLSRIEAQRKIERLYRDSLLANPLIELRIANLKVQAFGEIKTQGNFTLTKEYTTLIDILGQAGGLTAAADEKNVKIIRHERTGVRETRIDLSDINILTDPRIVLQADDIIYIAQNKRAVRDDNLQNVTTLIQPSILIFNTALIIYSLFR